MSERRSVDWTALPGEGLTAPSLVEIPRALPEEELLRALEDMAKIDDFDALLRRAVEIVRFEIGLERAGIFLLDERTNEMLGTWGTGPDGEIKSEAHVMYRLGPSDRDVFARAEARIARYTVFENCPLVVHLDSETRVVGRGWVSCTPVRSTRETLGMLFVDGGPRGASFDEAKQAQVVVLCTVLGAVLELARGAVLELARGAVLDPSRATRSSAESGSSAETAPKKPKIVRVVRLLAARIDVESDELAALVETTPSHLARLFKKEMGVSLVEYRNRLRLERFFALVDEEGKNLLGSALEAGFGSYAQFHRVFRDLLGQSPRDYLKHARSRVRTERPD